MILEKIDNLKHEKKLQKQWRNTSLKLIKKKKNRKKIIKNTSLKLIKKENKSAIKINN